VEDTAKTLEFYKDLFGFDPQAGPDFSDNTNLMALAGTPGARVKRSTAVIPGTSVLVEFLEFQNIDRKMNRTRTQDPGTGSLQLRVRDIHAMAKKLNGAGDIVISANGQPQNVPGLTLFFARDPNNIIVELLESRSTK